MRILFAFEDDASQATAALLAERARGLRAVGAVSSCFVVPKNHGARATLASIGPVYEEPNQDTLTDVIDRGGYDACVIIDALRMVEVTSARPPRTPPWVEVRERLAKHLDSRALRGAEGILAPSAHLEARLSALRPEDASRVARVTDAIDPGTFSPDAIEGRPERRILVFRGDFEDDGGGLDALELAARARAAGHDLELWVLTSASTGEALAAMALATADTLALTSRLRVFEDLSPMATARALALAGKSGGALLTLGRGSATGREVAEALLAGCPVIAVESGASTEPAPGQPYLFTFEASRPDRAEEALHALLGEGKRPLARALLADRGRIVDRYATEATGAVYLEQLRARAGRS